MSHLVPLMFSLENKNVVIIGGGQIAFRKAKAFIKSGATITIISPQLINELKELKNITWSKKNFEKEDIKDAHFIIAATNNHEVNQYIKECASEHQWVNVVSDQHQCDFHTPAVIQRGDLIVSVSTSGKSPTLSKKIKNELENYFDDHYIELVEQYGKNRVKVKEIRDKE